MRLEPHVFREIYPLLNLMTLKKCLCYCYFYSYNVSDPIHDPITIPVYIQMAVQMGPCLPPETVGWDQFFLTVLSTVVNRTHWIAEDGKC